jgi:hypothetical protein
VIVYRHASSLTPPDLDGWQPRELGAAICTQRTEAHQYVAVCDPVLWRIPTGATWKPLADGWEVARVAAGGILPTRDLGRLDCFASVLTVADAAGEEWLAPVILTPDGSRAFSVHYSGEDFLPALTDIQARAEAIAREARTELTRALENSAGIPLTPACRWAAFLLSVSSHVSAATVAQAGILDDTLVRRVLIAASGLDRRFDGEGA